MKTKVIVTILFVGILILNGCKKDGIMDGRKSIEGSVYYHDGVSPPNTIAPGANVYITYGSKTSTGTVDETTTTDATGKYSVRGLKKGDYFVSAEYTTSAGFVYKTQGHGVTIEGSMNKATLNIDLY
jgi:hypothetical protein